MRTPEFYAAVYGIIRNTSWEILFQRRQNTGFSDGLLQLPSGHIEGKETYQEALVREMQEELGIDIALADISLSHILHRVNPQERVYFDVFLEVKAYEWELINREPEKCSELCFVDFSSESASQDVVVYNKNVLKCIEEGIHFSEILV